MNYMEFVIVFSILIGVMVVVIIGFLIYIVFGFLLKELVDFFDEYED